jgi:hypothetical protein
MADTGRYQPTRSTKGLIKLPGPVGHLTAPLSFPKGGPQQIIAGLVLKHAISVIYTPRVGDTLEGHIRSTKQDGYQPVLSPRYLVKFLAKG